MSSESRIVTPDELAESFGLRRTGETNDYSHDVWGLSCLIRREVDRYGIRTTREITSALVPTLTAMGEDPATARRQLKDVLEKLTELGELERGSVDRQRACLKPLPAWVRIGPDCAALLGTIAPSDLAFFPRDRAVQIVRWFRPEEESIACLESLGVTERSFADWLAAPGWRPPFDFPQPADSSLSGLWSHCIDRLRREGMTGGDGDRTTLRLVRPPPGSYFGRRDSESPEGRWATASEMEDGEFLGVQRGYSDEHWRPLLVQVESGRPARTLFVADEQQWLWALLARSLVVGPEEQVETDPSTGELHFTFPLPEQIVRVLRLIAVPSGPWRWQPTEGADPQLWRLWSGGHFA